MGLTIHYSLHANSRNPRAARKLVDALHHQASELSFKELDKIVDLSGPDCDFDRRERGDPLRWLLVQSQAFVLSADHGFAVTPTRVIAFSTLPGDECEPAHFGLARFPSRVISHGRRVTTGLSGWSWNSFCKTQFASNPDAGGLPNFFRCHVSIVTLLDYADKLGILKHVSDEGGFWERRDLEDLAEAVGRDNELIAAVYGQLKDQQGDQARSPLGDYPNFEHLEAKGRRKFPLPDSFLRPD